MTLHQLELPMLGSAMLSNPLVRHLIRQEDRRWDARARSSDLTPRRSENPWGWSQSRLEQDLGAAMYMRHELRGRFKSQVQIGPNRVDFAFPAERLVVEADGAAFHSGLRAFWRDRKRDRISFNVGGWRTLRFKESEIRQSAELCALRVARWIAKDAGRRLRL